MYIYALAYVIDIIWTCVKINWGVLIINPDVAEVMLLAFLTKIVRIQKLGRLV